MRSRPAPRRSKLASLAPGYVFWLPKGATWLNRDKQRPFALANRCTAAEPGILVYGSTQATEKNTGAAYIEVMPIRSGVSGNALESRTFFYPGIMVPVEHVDLPAHSGVLGKAMEDFRAAMRTALGIGTGSCLSTDAPAGSRRGRIVELEDDFAAILRTRFAAILTEHGYSREKNYHVVVPIIRGTRVADPTVLRIEGREWLRVFGEATPTGLVPVQVIQSAWYTDDIVAETPFVLDDGTLAAVEAQLVSRFGLGAAS